jgi:ABC-2 type transport system ATP-binding protein
MDEADKLSDRVAIIDVGKIIAMDTPSSLKENLGGSVIRIQTEKRELVQESLSRVDWINNTAVHNGYVDVMLHNAEKHIADVIKMLQDTPLESVSLRIPSLEEVFLNYTGKTIREQEASAKERLRHRTKASRR